MQSFALQDGIRAFDSESSRDVEILLGIMEQRPHWYTLFSHYIFEHPHR